jgi:hypothetical protein
MPHRRVNSATIAVRTPGKYNNYAATGAFNALKVRETPKSDQLRPDLPGARWSLDELLIAQKRLYNAWVRLGGTDPKELLEVLQSCGLDVNTRPVFKRGLRGIMCPVCGSLQSCRHSPRQQASL